MSQEFIIVVKAPKNRLNSKIVSFIDIQLTEDINEDSSKAKFVKMLDHKSRSFKKQKIVRKLDVLLLGYLDNPMVKCMKQLFNKQTNSEIVSLAVKRTGGIQKFKLPFKNLSTYLDADIEFAFIKTQNGGNERDPVENLSFYCQPNQLKIQSD